MCEYCEEDKDGYISLISKRGHIRVIPETKKLQIRYYGENLDVVINYCPMCGRNLIKGSDSI